jgi:hypothetical protein
MRYSHQNKKSYGSKNIIKRPYMAFQNAVEKRDNSLAITRLPLRRRSQPKICDFFTNQFELLDKVFNATLDKKMLKLTSSM